MPGWIARPSSTSSMSTGTCPGFAGAAGVRRSSESIGLQDRAVLLELRGVGEVLGVVSLPTGLAPQLDALEDAGPRGLALEARVVAQLLRDVAAPRLVDDDEGRGRDDEALELHHRG